MDIATVHPNPAWCVFYQHVQHQYSQLKNLIFPTVFTFLTEKDGGYS